MSDYLFAYGTLRPGYAPREMAPLVQQMRPVGAGSARGSLYDFGQYPGAILNPLSGRRIYGTVFELPEDPSFLSELDAYEEFDADTPESSQFIRALHPVEMADGRTVHCWVYAYNRDPGAAPLLESGIYPRSESPGTIDCDS
jgi:gamma-glutamylcyclotransferase (GGCT)/AIG2-like uncharacterized protein YtfP